MLNIPIFNGTIPDGERGHGCLVPTTPTPDDIVPLMSPDWLLTDDEIDTRCRAFKPIIFARLEKLRPKQIFQGNQGSCAASAGGNGNTLCNIAENEDVELPSQATIYAWDGVDKYGELIPRVADNGMALVSVVRVMEEIGIAPASKIPAKDWQQRNWPSDWERHASPNRLLERKRITGGTRRETLRALKSGVARPGLLLCGYQGHARLAVWRDPDTGIWTLVNSWESQPIHQLNDQQMVEGEEHYECFWLSSTVAR